MLRSMLIAGGCALELSLSIHEVALLGVEIGAITLGLAVCGTLSAARRISRELAGLNLPAADAFANSIDSRK